MICNTAAVTAFALPLLLLLLLLLWFCWCVQLLCCSAVAAAAAHAVRRRSTAVWDIAMCLSSPCATGLPFLDRCGRGSLGRATAAALEMLCRGTGAAAMHMLLLCCSATALSMRTEHNTSVCVGKALLREKGELKLQGPAVFCPRLLLLLCCCCCCCCVVGVRVLCNSACCFPVILRIPPPMKLITG